MLGGQHGSDSSLTRTVANCEQGMHTEGRLVLTVLVVSLVVIFLVRTAPPSEPEPKRARRDAEPQPPRTSVLPNMLHIHPFFSEGNGCGPNV